MKKKLNSQFSPEEINYPALKALSILTTDVQEFTTLASQIFNPVMSVYEQTKFKALLDATEVELSDIENDVKKLKLFLEEYKKSKVKR